MKIESSDFWANSIIYSLDGSIINCLKFWHKTVKTSFVTIIYMGPQSPQLRDPG